MCNCNKEMCDKIKAKLYPEAEHVSDQSRELLSGRTYSEFEITLPERKKPEIINVLHSYCPHCGERYEAKETTQ